MMMMRPADRPRVPSGIRCCSFKAPRGENLLIVFFFLIMISRMSKMMRRNRVFFSVKEIYIKMSVDDKL